MPTVTFETQCYENDYKYLFAGDRLSRTIESCNHAFDRKVVIINKVNDRAMVAAIAEGFRQRGIIDDYYFAEDHIQAALKHFGIEEDSFRGGYYYSTCQLVGLYLSKTDYTLHFTTDSTVGIKATADWISESIALMESDPRFVCATPVWNNSVDGARNEAVLDLGAWYAGYGFSDNCYLIPTRLFKQQIYGEYNQASERYPGYAGLCFERRVDSYMRNHDLMRLVYKNAGYETANFPLSTGRKIKKAFSRAKSLRQKVMQKLTRSSPVQKEAAPLSDGDRAAIAQYRKTVRVYDVFTFFNELELLEIRLAMLAPYVDTFVIIECAETFSGKPKPLYYQKNKERFKQYESKIRHYVVQGVPKNHADLEERRNDPNLDPLEREIINYALTSDNVPAGSTHWLKEFYQKEAIQKALVGLDNDDFCFVSDLDEIWNPQTVIDMRTDDVYKLRQDMYAYYLNNRSSEAWAGTLGTKYKNIKHNCLNHLRTPSKTRYTYVPNGGWHFTNQGGADRIRTKLESYGHQEFNTAEVKSDIETKIRENRDFVGRGFRFWKDESGLPQYLLDNKERYRNFFRD